MTHYMMLLHSLTIIVFNLVAHDTESTATHTNDVSVIQTNKRRFAEVYSQSMGESANSFGKVHSEKKVAPSGRIFANYTCARCDVEPMSVGSILKHLHNDCFPDDGLPCIDCRVKDPGTVNRKFKNFTEMLVHNVELHNNLTTWRCFACDTNVEKHNFYTHVKKSTNKDVHHTMMGAFKTNAYFTKFMRKASQKQLTSTQVSAVQKIPWQFYAVVGEKHKRKMVPVVVIDMTDE